MQVPTQITMRGLPHSEAVKAHIEEKVTKLQQFYDHMISCHVVIEFENKNQNRGNLHNTHITITVPGKELVTTHNEAEDMYVSIRDAFEDMTRQVEHYVEKLKQGTGQQSMLSGKIVRLFHGDGFGFIEGLDGTEFYFNANHVTHPAFDKLKIGMKVHFIQEAGHDGPQAHRVKAID
ncbi:MAG: ribosomal subunit interface protein [Gammaproteobacteria bacterium RIFCSPHIGHO2_12_FULL_38_11]|nr:MAG: ribosomal subunit interface protein [Gammaproteobacteria bacterium RIFCSPHIGHO2_12_FULL_38_11]